ncbi:MAG: hypothetical protein KDK41_16060 [Leptospiraceae bacterium]|nr:hypothetical protein [Leptospiraceae bacterium]
MLLLANSTLAPEVLTDTFKDYWFNGKAEISTYSLRQARYGEVHEGELVHIFVTEEFRTDRQVKKESNIPGPSVSVLKLNAIRRFPTGLYDYQLMSSIFTPLWENARSLKFTLSSQDWCGQSFLQMNLRENRWEVQSRSYFEAESDQNFDLKYVLYEDEIPVKIRIDPKSLPTGKLEIIPSATYTRFEHVPFTVLTATASVTSCNNTPSQNEYKLVFDNGRTVSFCYQKNFPYQIESMREKRMDGFGKSRKMLETIAIRKKTIHSDYWNRHHVKDLPKRRQLQLR